MNATTLVKSRFPDSILDWSGENTLTSEDEEVCVKSRPIQKYSASGTGVLPFAGIYPVVFPWSCFDHVTLVRALASTESLENATITGHILSTQPLLDEDETLKWDVALDSIPVRPRTRIKVSLKHVGRGKPIPIEDSLS